MDVNATIRKKSLAEEVAELISGRIGVGKIVWSGALFYS